VEWKIDGNQFVLHVNIPANTTASIVLPDGSSKEIGSGKYEFKCELNNVIFY
jgi:alpha-L-rhamnosidase